MNGSWFTSACLGPTCDRAKINITLKLKLCSRRQKLAGAFFKPKGILLNSNKPNGAMNADLALACYLLIETTREVECGKQLGTIQRIQTFVFISVFQSIWPLHLQYRRLIITSLHKEWREVKQNIAKNPKSRYHRDRYEMHLGKIQVLTLKASKKSLQWN